MQPQTSTAQKLLLAAAMIYLLTRAFFLCFNWQNYALLTLVESIDSPQYATPYLAKKAWNRKLEKLDPVTQKFIKGSQPEESLYQWSKALHSADPDNLIYIAYHTAFLFQEVIAGKEKPEALFQLTEEWKKKDSGNAMPYFYKAAFLLIKNMEEHTNEIMIIEDGKEKRKTVYEYSILDKKAVEQGIREYLTGIQKPYATVYSLQSIKQKLQLLDLEQTPLGIMQRIIISAGELLPYLQIERDLARRLTFLTKEMHRNGNPEKARELVESGRKYIQIRLEKTDHFLLTILVQNAICKLWCEAAELTGNQQMKQIYQKTVEEFQTWREKKDSNNENIARYAGILSAMLLPALKWEIPVSYYRSERMINYLLLDQFALGLIFLLFAGMIFVFAAITLFSSLSGGKPVFVVLTPKSLLKLLLTAIILPLAAYLMFTHIELFSGRDVNLMNNIPRTVFQLLFLLAIPVWTAGKIFEELSVSCPGNVKDRCAGMIVPLIVSLFLIAGCLSAIYKAETRHYIENDKMFSTEFGFSSVEAEVTKSLTAQMLKNLK